MWFAYEQIFQGSLFDFHAMRLLIDHPNKANLANALGPISLTLQDATPLIVAGLGLAIGFRSNIFDIGGQGQVIAGGLIAGLIGFSLNVTPVLQVSLELIAAMIAGALLASLAGVLKAYTGAHEVIVTMMSNYIMVLLLGYLLITNLFARPGVKDGASQGRDRDRSTAVLLLASEFRTPGQRRIPHRASRWSSSSSGSSTAPRPASSY